MKKIIYLIIGIIIGISIGVGASAVINAKEIKYSNAKASVTNVSDALDYLINDSFTLDKTTSVNSSNLLKGVTAYNSNGVLITGTYEDNCVRGEYVKEANSQIQINLGFDPSFYIINIPEYSIGKIVAYYDKNMNSNIMLYRVYNTSIEVWNYISISNGVMTSSVKTGSNIYTNKQTISYVACK